MFWQIPFRLAAAPWPRRSVLGAVPLHAIYRALCFRWMPTRLPAKVEDGYVVDEGDLARRYFFSQLSPKERRQLAFLELACVGLLGAATVFRREDPDLVDGIWIAKTLEPVPTLVSGTVRRGHARPSTIRRVACTRLGYVSDSNRMGDLLSSWLADAGDCVVMSTRALATAAA